jgi:hypothetical protein
MFKGTIDIRSNSPNIWYDTNRISHVFANGSQYNKYCFFCQGENKIVAIIRHKNVPFKKEILSISTTH